ncbi:MAG: hypothetical protein ABH848_04740 [Candidatus Omnitrophota bacterium]
MAQERHVTPEKQLLSLIEDSGKGNAKVKTYKAKHQGLSLFSLSVWKSKLSFLVDRITRSFKTKETFQINVKALNRILILLIFFLMIFGVNIFLTSMSSLDKMPALELGSSKDIEIGSVKESPVLKKNVYYYLDKVSDRNIFKMGTQEEVAEIIETEELVERPDQKVAIKSALSENMANLKLVGISWSASPDAIIENTTTYNTYFVKRGQTVGELKVEAVLKDKVILSYEGEEAELK